jgi:uncharacterized protein (TIGR02001 family)
MKKLILAAAVTAAFTGSFAYAEDAAPAAAPTPDNVVAYNIGLASDYRYRGISQSRFQPALQGGVDYTNNPTGLYAGTWLSTIKWIKDTLLVGGNPNGKGPVEWDLYGGKRGDIGGGFNYDVGGLYYYYPTNNYNSVPPNTNANTFELYGQIGYGTAYIKYSDSLTTLFGNVDSKNSGYLDLGWNPDVGAGFTLNLHVGHQKVAGSGEAAAGVSNNLYSYTDWKIGVSKTVDQLAGITFSLAAVGTNAREHNPYATPVGIPAYSSPSFKNLGKNGVVLTAVKTF